MWAEGFDRRVEFEAALSLQQTQRGKDRKDSAAQKGNHQNLPL